MDMENSTHCLGANVRVTSYIDPPSERYDQLHFGIIILGLGTVIVVGFTANVYLIIGLARDIDGIAYSSSVFMLQVNQCCLMYFFMSQV